MAKNAIIISIRPTPTIGGVKAPIRKGFAGLLAFTLAEVLIVLGIIGIIAEMTIPTLMTNVQLAELQNEYKKAYSDLNQITQKFQADYNESVSEYTDMTQNPEGTNYSDFKLNIFPSYFKNYKQQDRNHYIMPLSSATGSWDMGFCDASKNYVDGNGRFWRFDDANYSGENGPKICVDVNGDKGPNRQGWDNFVFLFTTSGKAIPMGASDPNNPKQRYMYYINFSVPAEDHCKIGSHLENVACAYYALLDRSPLDSSKSYWHDFLPSVK